LLELDPGELVEVARECYQAELAGRSLKRQADNAAEPTEPAFPIFSITSVRSYE
jgi:hypothetical protein